MDVVLAIDIGGTSTRVTIQSLSGEELARRVLCTRPHDYDQALMEIIEAGRFLIRNHRLVAIGVGVAGVVSNGILTGSGNLSAWVNRNIRLDLSQPFGVPVAVLNDAEAAGLGEYAAFGRPLIYVIWGTGIGVALVIDDNGRLVTLATELGHITIDRNSRLKCGCGGYGHLEALVGGANIPKRRFGLWRGRKAEHLNDRHWSKLLRDMAVGLRSISASAIGLPIVLGGGVSTKQAHRLPELQRKVNSLRSSNPTPTLLSAKHGENSGLVGAGYAARQLVAA